LKIPTKRLELLTWLLIYLGLFAIALGATLRRQGAVLGWSVIVGGAVATAAGLVLIWVRSRMADPPA